MGSRYAEYHFFITFKRTALFLASNFLSEPEQLEFYERFHERLLAPRAAYDAGSTTGAELLLENIAARSALFLELGRLEESRSLCEEGLALCGDVIETEGEQASCTYLKEFHDRHFSTAAGG